MICIAENNGEGGLNGGAGAEGQASQNATGSGATGYGFPVLECVTGTPCTLVVQLTKDYDGTVPSDLSGISDVKFVAKASMSTQNPKIEKNCTFTEDGIVELELGEKELNYHNGVWYAEFRCSDSQHIDRQNYRAWLCIRKGTKGSNPYSPTTITALDVRMAIMDTSALTNTLIDDLEFSDAQIFHAVHRCINEFNEIPPQISRIYNGTNFPWTEHLIKGVAGCLLQEKAYQYLRNKMNYSAAGFTYDQSDKGNTYIQLANAAKQEWHMFINSKKTELNMSDCFGMVDITAFDGSKGVW